MTKVSYQSQRLIMIRRCLSTLLYSSLFFHTISCTRVDVDISSTAQKLSLFTVVANQGSQASVASGSNVNLHFEGSCDARVLSVKVLRADGSEADVAAIMNPGGDIDCSDKGIAFDIPALLLSNGKDISHSDQTITFIGKSQATETFPVVITLVPASSSGGGSTPPAGGGGTTGGTTGSGSGTTGSGSGSGTGTASSVLDFITGSDLVITDLYPISKTWGKWIKYDSSSKTYSLCGTSSPCFPGYFQKTVSISKLSSCSQLIATDALNIYEWSCQIRSGHVQWIGTMKSEKKLIDLLAVDPNSSSASWKSDQFILRDSVQGKTVPSGLATLFSNSILYVSGDSSGQGLTANDSGKIVIFQDGKLIDGFYSGSSNPAITVNNVSIVIPGTASFTSGKGGSSAFMFRFYKSNEFYIEGNLNLNSEVTGGGAIRISESNRGVLRHMNIFNAASGSIGVLLRNGNQICTSTCTGEILFQRTVLAQLPVGMRMDLKTTDVRIYESQFVGNDIGIDMQSVNSDLLVESSLFSNQTTAGLQVDFGSTQGKTVSLIDSLLVSNQIGVLSKGTGSRSIQFKNIYAESNAEVFQDVDGGSLLNWIVGVQHHNQSVGQTSGGLRTFVGPQLIQNIANTKSLMDLQGVDIMSSDPNVFTSSAPGILDMTINSNQNLQDLSLFVVSPVSVLMDLTNINLGSSNVPVQSISLTQSGLRSPSSLASSDASADLSAKIDASCSLVGNSQLASVSAVGGSFLVHGTEISNPTDPHFTGTGNLNGFCQSGKTCHYTPFAGSYQVPIYLGNISQQSCSVGSLSGTILWGYSL
jgi:hypothetical protein